MAFTKITTSDLNSRGATTLSNQPTISASALKQEFDAPAKEVVAPKFNNLIDELGATSAAANIGAVTPTGRTGNTVQTVINKISTDLATVESEIGEAIAEAHTHLNKELLDTYTQTNENIAQAIADDHTHANKNLLDTYEQTEEDLAEAVVNTHSHDNKTVLDKFDEEDGQPTYDGNPIGAGDMYASDYDPDDTVKNAGGIVDYVESQAYELPAATSNTLGGVMQGTNVSIDANGVISATDTTYTDATTSQSGLMSATDKTKLDGIEANANNYSLPTASTSQLGGVKVDGSTVTIDGNGVISSSGGGGGTTVVANPSGTATDDLEKLQVGTTIYEIPDTTYESKQAAQGGTDVSLVTTGEKYTWNEKVSKSATAGLLKNDGTVDQTQYVSDISGKADKVSTATNGNFAGLDSNGNLTDSGKSSSDFLPSNTPIPDEVTANPTGTATGTLTKLGIGSDIYEIQSGGTDENAYHIGDTAETALADDDYFPFYDTSASAKRKTLWSNIKSVLSNLFAKKTDIAPVENGTTASKAYAVGQQFYLSDGKLYKCKQPIAQGATFTIGTNCELALNITDCLTRWNYDEHLTGEYWIDGKPIYQKTVVLSTAPNNADVYVDTGVLIDQVIDYTFIVANKTDRAQAGCFELARTNMGYAIYTNRTTMSDRKNKVNWYSTSNLTGYSAYMTFKYTKI